MAVWIARVTVEANHFRLEDGTVVRDSQASPVQQGKQRGRKRPAMEVTAVSVPAAERLMKHPRLAALRERILAKISG